jgi:hypothetical protein
MSGSTTSSIYNTLFDPSAAMAAPDAAAAGPANALAPQAPAISPMWANWGGFGNAPGGGPNPAGGAVPAATNPGFMTFAQAQAQAALPGQNPFAGVDPGHPLWQLMFNEYTGQGQTDPRALFQQIGQRSGGTEGGGPGGVEVSGGAGSWG